CRMAEGWLVMKGSMMRQEAASCHRPRNATSTARRTAATLASRRRNARRYSACRSDAAPRAKRPLAGMSLDIQVLPDRLAVGAKLRRVARAQRRALRRDGERDVVDALDLRRPPAQDDDAVGERHRLLHVVRHQQRGLALLTNDAVDVALENELGL